VTNPSRAAITDVRTPPGRRTPAIAVVPDARNGRRRSALGARQRLPRLVPARRRSERKRSLSRTLNSDRDRDQPAPPASPTSGSSGLRRRNRTQGRHPVQARSGNQKGTSARSSAEREHQQNGADPEQAPRAASTMRRQGDETRSLASAAKAPASPPARRGPPGGVRRLRISSMKRGCWRSSGMSPDPETPSVPRVRWSHGVTPGRSRGARRPAASGSLARARVLLEPSRSGSEKRGAQPRLAAAAPGAVAVVGEDGLLVRAISSRRPGSVRFPSTTTSSSPTHGAVDFCSAWRSARAGRFWARSFWNVGLDCVWVPGPSRARHPRATEQHRRRGGRCGPAHRAPTGGRAGAHPRPPVARDQLTRGRATRPPSSSPSSRATAAGAGSRPPAGSRRARPTPA